MLNMIRLLFPVVALAMLSACSGGAQLSPGDPFSYFDQKDMNMYYWSQNCSAALCNPR